MAGPQSTRPGAADSTESGFDCFFWRKHGLDFQVGGRPSGGGILRAAVELRIAGIRLQGTYHRGGGGQAKAARVPGPVGEIGILSSNAGYQPRSAQGDLAAHLADHTSKLGFPSFRFDMPGLGDSDGELSAEVLPFYEVVQDGGHVQYISAVQAELLCQYGLKGMILLGHCGSATTAVYAAEQDPSPNLLGLILVEPSFVWYRAPVRSRANRDGNSILHVKQKVSLLRHRLRGWLVQKPGGEKVTLLYSQMVVWCRRLLRTQVPKDSNRRLLICYRKLLARGIPILMLTAPPEKRRPDYFDYGRYLHGDRPPGNFTLVEVQGASHSFLEGNGKGALFDAVQRWLRENFANSVAVTPGEPALPPG